MAPSSSTPTGALLLLEGLQAYRTGNPPKAEWEARALEVPETWFGEAWSMLGSLSPDASDGRQLFALMVQAWPRLPPADQQHWGRTFARLDTILVVRGAQSLWNEAWPGVRDAPQGC